MATTNMDKEKQAFDEARHETSQAASDIAGRAKQAAGTVADKARDAARAAGEKADQALSSTGSTVAGMGSRMREGGPQEGYLGRANSAVAGTIEQTGRYLEEHGLSGMADDMTSMIRRNPIPAVLVGVGVGFLLARLTSSSNSRSY